MKVSAVIKPTISLDHTKKSAIISCGVIVSGIIVGTIIYLLSKDDLASRLLDYFISFSMDFTHKNKSEILSGLIFENLIYFILMLIFGTSVIGTPAVFAVSFIKSAGLSLLTAYIYDSFALKGIEYCLLVLFPGKYFLIFAMLLLTQNCYYMSIGILKCVKNADGRGVNFKKFSARSILILAFLILSAVIDFITIISFSSLFNFG